MTRAQTSLVLSGLAVVLPAVAFGAGWWQGRSRVSELEGSLETVETNASEQQRRADRLEARRQLDLAVRALNAMNFGIAESRVRAASPLLLRSAGTSAELRALAVSVQNLSLLSAAAGNAAEHRRRLEEMIARFDTLVPPAK